MESRAKYLNNESSPFPKFPQSFPMKKMFQEISNEVSLSKNGDEFGYYHERRKNNGKAKKKN